MNIKTYIIWIIEKIIVTLLCKEYVIRLKTNNGNINIP